MTLSVTAIDPIPNATINNSLYPITITFSDIITQGITFNNIKLINSSNQAKILKSVVISGNKLIITPKYVYTEEMYRVYIPKSSIYDSIGNGLNADYNSYFLYSPYLSTDDLTKWKVTSGTVQIDRTHYETGIGSLKCTTDGTIYHTAGAEIDVDMDFWEQVPVFHAMFDILNPADRFIVEAYSGNTKYAQRWFSRDKSLVPGYWWDFAFNKVDAKSYNGFTDEDYHDITKIRTYFTSTSAAAKSGYVNSFYIHDLDNKSHVMFRNDDGLLTDYTICAPILSKYDYHLTLYMITNILEGVTNSNYMNPSQTDEMYDMGHDISAHTNDHDYLSQLNSKDKAYQILHPYDLLYDRGYKRSCNYFAVPYFDIDLEGLKLINHIYRNSGCGPNYGGNKTLNLTGGIGTYPNPLPRLDQMSPSNALAVEVPLTIWEQTLDLINHYGEFLQISNHQVYDETILKYICDYCNENGIEVKNMSEYDKAYFKHDKKIKLEHLIDYI